MTQLLGRARSGDADALDAVFALMYPELRKVAHQRLAPHREKGLMQTTALVNECYLRFREAGRVAPEDRNHFMAYGSQVMRSIIVDLARRRLATRRGGEQRDLTLDTDLGDGAMGDGMPEQEVLDIHDALEHLARLDERLAKVVEMRYFGGMDDAEIGAALGVTDRTVRRDWDKARVLLARVLK
ncbi:MAG: ECF-type sigma factor [Gammaproteobacteria bacterium]